MQKGNNITNCKNCVARFNSIFCEIEDADINSLNANKGCSHYKKGQVIFKQGSTPHGIYVVYSGKVKLFQLAENGREQIIRMTKPGDVVGYRALLGNEKYTASAETIEESNICFIPRELFFNSMSRNSTITTHLMNLLSHDLKNAERKITDLAQKPVRERMAEALLFIKETYGYENDKRTLNVVLKREELANLIGVTTETAIRLLADFKRERLIDLIGKKIKITNIQKLIDVTNVHD
jgi:CRP/FNR family transcriptional regulator, polysaccharide utilization system transcription regulator